MKDKKFSKSPRSNERYTQKRDNRFKNNTRDSLRTYDNQPREDLTESGIVAGRNAVRELLKSGRDIDKIFTQAGEREGSIVVLAAEAIARGIPVVETEKNKLDTLSGFTAHQGIVAMAAFKGYFSPLAQVYVPCPLRASAAYSPSYTSPFFQVYTPWPSF